MVPVASGSLQLTSLINDVWNYKVIRCLSYFLIGYLILYILDDVLKIGVSPKIEGCLAIPGYPIVGNYFQVLNNPSLVYINWMKKYKTKIFQIRLGSVRAVVVNTYEDVSEIWIKHSCSVNSRPVLHLFHNIVSATQGFTVGSTPAGPSYKNKKKAISMALNHRNVINLRSLFDKETKYTIKKIIKNNLELQGPPSCNTCRYSRSLLSDIDFLPYAQLFVLRTAIYVTYGITLDVYGGDRSLAGEIIEVESNIMRFRAPFANTEDYFPLVSYLPFAKAAKAQEYRDRRDKYMNYLFVELKKRLAKGDGAASNSLIGKIISSDEGTSKLNSAEVQSICLTMVSAGLDNTSLNLDYMLGILSQPQYGYLCQQKAFDELIKLYDNDVCTAWDKVAIEVKCNYIVAFIKEAMRSFTVLPVGMPRLSTKTINYKGITIPKNTMMLMNAYAANHDPDEFNNPYVFRPERWIDTSSGEVLSKKVVDHMSFGAGSRMCSGNHLAFNEMYVLICRIILTFKVRRPTSGQYLMSLDPFSSNLQPQAISFEPKPFKVKLEPRHNENSDKLYLKILHT